MHWIVTRKSGQVYVRKGRASVWNVNYGGGVRNTRRRAQLRRRRAQLRRRRSQLRRRRSLISAQGWSAATTLGSGHKVIETLKGFANRLTLSGFGRNLKLCPRVLACARTLG